MNQSFATIWEAIAAALPDQVAIRHGARTRTYREFDDRAGRLAAALEEAGIGPGDKVACFLYNCPECLETLFGALKLSAIPVNVNYRYQRDELRSLLADSDVDAIVFHTALGDRVEAVAGDLPRIRLQIEVPDEPGLPVRRAVAYEDLIAGREPVRPRPRSGDDQLFTYTGGTTGTPKGVVWIHSALFDATAFSAYNAAGFDPPASLEGALQVARALKESGKRPVSLPVVPLMHTTGLFITIGTLLVGGEVVFSASRSLHPPTTWRQVEEEGVTQLVIAGDAVGRPLADELERADREGRPYDTSSLQRIISSGVAWSDEVKRRFLVRQPVQLIEILGASEGGPFAYAVVGDVADLPTRFRPASGTKVLAEDDSELMPGSGEVGVLAFTGPMPLGYYKDGRRTAATYRWIDGRRYAIPGDFAQVAPDGSIRFLGRGAAVINTGGEKVYPKEVEDAILSHPDVVDCVVLGVPDERWGEMVGAVVQLRTGSASPEELMDHVGTQLAGYKKPRHVVIVDSLERGPNGKLELRWAKETLAGRPA